MVLETSTVLQFSRFSLRWPLIFFKHILKYNDISLKHSKSHNNKGIEYKEEIFSVSHSYVKIHMYYLTFL